MINIVKKHTPTTAVKVIDGTASSAMVDLSSHRDTLTANSVAMSSGVTPPFGATSMYFTAPNCYVGYTTKRITGTYTTPFTGEVFFNPSTTLNTTNAYVFAGEADSITAPANGNWFAAFYQGRLRIHRYTGSSTTCYRIALGDGTITFTAGTWYHVFFQVNSDTTHTIGYGCPSTGYTGTILTGTPTTLSQAPNVANYGLGPGTGWGDAVLNSYMQAYRLTDGIARYPTSGTYKIPIYPGM